MLKRCCQDKHTIFTHE